MSPEGQVFGLRVANLLPAFTLPSRFRGTSGLAAFAWGLVTRYRSATVAGSHGLPWILRGKELPKAWTFKVWWSIEGFDYDEDEDEEG